MPLTNRAPQPPESPQPIRRAKSTVIVENDGLPRQDIATKAEDVLEKVKTYFESEELN